MGHLFSKKQQSKVTEQDKAVLQLKTTRDKIRQYQKRSEGKLETDRSLAKQLLRDGRKERAKLLLRKKRFIEEQLKKTDGTLENIERMIEDIEFAQIQVKVVDSLRVGNESLKQVSAMLDIEDIERILDETQEAAEKQQARDQRPPRWRSLDDEDESAVEEELDALIAAAVQKQLSDAPTAAENPEVELPDVPETLPGFWSSGGVRTFTSQLLRVSCQLGFDVLLPTAPPSVGGGLLRRADPAAEDLSPTKDWKRCVPVTTPPHRLTLSPEGLAHLVSAIIPCRRSNEATVTLKGSSCDRGQ
ncbi:Charged multivesicular body protein 6 [Chionoecetes opilio]|uniref:Charged multivesicular body protein 6 n=1 Tax=Chionoecetes opilio TaxID=41210 RepID=A0A8J4Y9B0_CHIOP|nr:Charged multivesicular body protein 6 [Chionoecetes opilio]